MSLDENFDPESSRARAVDASVKEFVEDKGLSADQALILRTLVANKFEGNDDPISLESSSWKNALKHKALRLIGENLPEINNWKVRLRIPLETLFGEELAENIEDGDIELTERGGELKAVNESVSGETYYQLMANKFNSDRALYGHYHRMLTALDLIFKGSRTLSVSSDEVVCEGRLVPGQTTLDLIDFITKNCWGTRIDSLDKSLDELSETA